MAELVCGDCGRQLRCTKTGKTVYWKNVAHPGDEFKCPECGYHVITCSPNSYVVEEDRIGFHGIRGREWHEKLWTEEEKEKSKKLREPL